MEYLLARSELTEDVVALVQIRKMPNNAKLVDTMTDEFSEWRTPNEVDFVQFEEITREEWYSYLEFGVAEPYRICSWVEAVFRDRGNGVESQIGEQWQWTFHIADDLKM